MSIFGETDDHVGEGSTGGASSAYSQHINTSTSQDLGNPFGSDDNMFEDPLFRAPKTVVSPSPRSGPPPEDNPPRPSPAVIAASSPPPQQQSSPVAASSPAVAASSPVQPQQQSQPAFASSPSFHEVKVAQSSPLASSSLLPSPTDEREFDTSKVKHGKIVVGEAELRGGKFTGYHVYKVSCANGTVEHVYRRYSDFEWLRKCLVRAFPGIFVPPLPSKQLLGSKDESFVETRRNDLQRWLTRVTIRSYLSEHSATELFLYKATAAFEQDQKDLWKSIDNKSLGEIISNYKLLFPDIVKLGSNEDTEIEIEAIREFLVHSEQKMARLVELTDKYTNTTHANVQQLNAVTSNFLSTFESEKTFLAHLPHILTSQNIQSRIDITESYINWSNGSKSASYSYDELFLAPVKFELQDIQAMIDVIKTRNELAAKHVKSVTRANKWGLPGNAPKKEKQEVEKQQDEQQAKEEGILLNLSTKLILHSQFEQFWSFRIEQFRKRMFRFAKSQMDATKQLYDNWQQIAQATAVGQ